MSRRTPSPSFVGRGRDGGRLTPGPYALPPPVSGHDRDERRGERKQADKSKQRGGGRHRSASRGRAAVCVIGRGDDDVRRAHGIVATRAPCAQAPTARVICALVVQSAARDALCDEDTIRARAIVSCVHRRDVVPSRCTRVMHDAPHASPRPTHRPDHAHVPAPATFQARHGPEGQGRARARARIAQRDGTHVDRHGPS